MQKNARIVGMCGDTLKLAILNGLQLHLQNFVLQKEPKTLQDVVSAARLAELTIPAKKDINESLYAKLDKMMQCIEDSKSTTAFVQQGSSPKPKTISFGNTSSEQHNFSGPRNFRLSYTGSGPIREFTQHFYPSYRSSHNYRPRFNESPNCGNYQSRQWRPIKSCRVTSRQPGRCSRCGLEHYPHINYCPASNCFCWRCSRRSHFARACRTRIGATSDISNSSCRFRPRSYFSRGRPQRYMAPKSQNTIIHQPIQRRNYMIAHLNIEPVKNYIDSGSVVTLVTERFANKHKLTITPTDDPAVTKLFSAKTGDMNHRNH